MYTPYVIEPTKSTWEGGFPVPPQYLSLKEDAQKVADGVEGVLSNAVDLFKGTPMAFVLDAADPRQPWIVTLNGSWSFAGLSILDPVSNTGMYAPNTVNGGGIGNPGSFKQNQVTKLFSWTPVAPPPPPPPPAPVHTGPSDADVFAGAVMGATTMTTQQFQTEVVYWLRAMGGRMGVSPPTA